MTTPRKDRTIRTGWVGCALLAALLTTWTILPPARADDDAPDAPADAQAEEQPPRTSKEAAERARPLIATARALPPKHRDAREPIRTARDLLEPFAEKVRKARGDNLEDLRPLQSHEALVLAYNEALTVAHYHGLKPSDPYFTVPLPKSFCGGDLKGEVPYGPHWTYKLKSWNDQENCNIVQKRPNGNQLRLIKVWQYQWDTVYSGVGGENTKGLAKMIHEVDIALMAKKGRKVSNRVTARRLNKAFPRAQYYYAEGFDVTLEKRVRSLDYYVKGDRMTFNVDLTAMIDPHKDDDAVTAWQATDDDPEMQVFLESIDFAPKAEKK